MYRQLHPHPHTCIRSSTPMLLVIHVNVLIPSMVLPLNQSGTPSCSLCILPLVQVHLHTSAVPHPGHSHVLTCHCDACYGACACGPCYGFSLLLSLGPFIIIFMQGMPVSRFPLSSQMLLTVQSASNLTSFLAEDPLTYSSFYEGEY